MKAGDLIRWNHRALDDNDFITGIVIDLQDDLVVPPIARVMWHSGEITKEWIDELEVISAPG
tara:strand:- start:386 stop:571 length:186 start_codon:yes stop_codon:yes gene_type:complete